MQFSTIALVSAGLFASAVTAIQTPTTLSCGNGVKYALMGCYIDDAARYLGTQKEIIYPVGIDECIRRCTAANAKFCSMQDGNACIMGNKFNRPMQIVPIEECNKPCHGDKSRTCGAPWRNQVYARVGTCISTPDMCPNVRRLRF